MKAIFLYLMVLFYAAAGANHFWHPDFYLKIMPPYLPFHRALVCISGAAEIILALLLLPASARPVAAWCLIIFLIAIFPANIQMSINYYKTHDPNAWLTLLRLPLQLLLIWWAYLYTNRR